MARRVSPRIIKRIVQGPGTHFKLEWGCLSTGVSKSKKIMDSEELDSRPHPSPTVAERENQSFSPSKSREVSNQKI